jgi:hypothetical protein
MYSADVYIFELSCRRGENVPCSLKVESIPQAKKFTDLTLKCINNLEPFIRVHLSVWLEQREEEDYCNPFF